MVRKVLSTLRYVIWVSQVDWDKGCALTHLLGALGLEDGRGVLSLYIGDDRTDEDAFRALDSRPHGFGILVSCKA